MKDVFPWWQVAEDIAKECNLSTDEEIELATKVGEALYADKLKPLRSSGMPGILPGGILRRRASDPYLSATNVNPWLEKNFPPFTWSPPKTQQQTTPKMGRPKSATSMRALKESGDLAIAAKAAAKRVHRKGRIVTQLTVANELKRVDYQPKRYKFDVGVLLRELHNSMWE